LSLCSRELFLLFVLSFVVYLGGWEFWTKTDQKANARNAIACVSVDGTDSGLLLLSNTIDTLTAGIQLSKLNNSSSQVSA